MYNCIPNDCEYITYHTFIVSPHSCSLLSVMNHSITRFRSYYTAIADRMHSRLFIVRLVRIRNNAYRYLINVTAFMGFTGCYEHRIVQRTVFDTFVVSIHAYFLCNRAFRDVRRFFQIRFRATNSQHSGRDFYAYKIFCQINKILFIITL